MLSMSYMWEYGLHGKLRYQGEFGQAEKELALSTEYCKKTNDQQGLCLDESYRSLAAILQGDYPQALESATRAHKIASSRQNERDLIRAEWLLGAAYRGKGQLSEAETHLHKAITNCRRINMVDHEANILLELARLRRDQANVAEPHNLALEALDIANRSQYRLQQADIHLFLAQLALDSGDKDNARQQAEVAHERAACGYKPTLDATQRFLAGLETIS